MIHDDLMTANDLFKSTWEDGQWVCPSPFWVGWTRTYIRFTIRNIGHIQLNRPRLLGGWVAHDSRLP